MIQRYSAFKDSGIEWIGEIPGHWEVRKLKYLTAYNEITLPENSDPELLVNYIEISDVNSEGEVLNLTAYAFKDAPSRCRRVLRKNDVFISTVRTYLKAIAFVGEENENLICSTGFCVLTAKRQINPKYLFYSCLNEIFLHSVISKSVGVSYPAINASELVEIGFTLPSDFEQSQIVEFLDRKTALIDRLIAAKERRIELLKEQRTALINHAVTKGLDPNVKMKDSGIEWIGEIPEHWEVTKLGFYTTKIGAGSTPSGGSEVYLDTGIPFIRSQNVLFSGLNLEGVAFIDHSTHESMSGTIVRQWDVLLNITGGSIGRCCVVESDIEMNVNQHVSIIRTVDKLNRFYLNYFLQSEIGQSQVRFNLTGGNREGLTIEGIRNFFLAFPENVEQQQIVTYLNAETQKIDSLVSLEQKKIDLLKEYRQALISEAVTGKIKVTKE